MTTSGQPSKWNHTLDDAQITFMLEPMPGTQIIYEHINDCSNLNLSKVYPPNSTVILNNTCPKLSIVILGEVRKLVVEQNYGFIDLGTYDWQQVLPVVHTEEVVIKNNDAPYKFGILIYNLVDRVEIQSNRARIEFFSRVTEHVDLRSNDGSINIGT